MPDIEVVLVSAGIIDALQLQAARGQQRRWGRTLIQAVVDLGFVAEEELFAKLAEVAGVEYVRIGSRHVPPEALRRVPARLVHRRRVFPLELEDGRRGPLVVAMEDPRDLTVVDEITFAAATPVRAVLASATDLDQAIARHYGAAAPPGRTAGHRTR